MVRIKESKVMIELEEIRDQHLKETEGMSSEEILRFYEAEAEKTRRSLGLNLTRRERVKA